MKPPFSISIIKSRKITAPSWEDAELEAEIWSLDEKSTGYSISELYEDTENPN